MNIQSKVIEIIAKELDADHATISGGSMLVDLGVDSPHLLEVALAIEEQFGIKVPDGELARFRTVDDVIRYVQTHARTG